MKLFAALGHMRISSLGGTRDEKKNEKSSRFSFSNDVIRE